MKRAIVLFCLFMSVCIRANAQWGNDAMDEKPKLKDRLFTGGGLGMNFSSYSDYISISPLIGLKVTDKLATGIGFQYRYTSYKTVSPAISTNDYGASPFVRYYIYNPFFLHSEYEYLTYQVINNGEKFRRSYGSLMTGGGIFQPFGGRAGLFVMALYNLTYRNPSSPYDYSPYSSPWVLRAGVTLGF